MDRAAASRRRLGKITIALVFFVLLLLLGGYVDYASEKGRIYREMEEDLAAIADLKVSQIVQWWDERKGDGEVLLVNRGLAQQAADAFGSPPGSAPWREMVEWAKKTGEAFRYRTVVLLDPEGVPVLGAGEDIDRVAEVTREAAREAARTGRVTTVDLHKGVGGRLALNVLAPLRASPTGETAVAVVLLRIDPNDLLFPLIQRWPTPSTTGESLLVRQEGEDLVYLNEVRHVRGAALTMRLPMDTPRLIAAEGIRRQTGLIKGVDYRGVAVVGVVRSVLGTPWYLVAKVDAEEVNRPVREGAWSIVLLLGLLLLAAGSSVMFLEKRQQTRLYRRLYEAAVERQALVRHFDWLTRYANDVILLSDGDQRIVEVNDRALSVYGYGREELVGMPLRDLFAPANVHDHDRSHEKAKGIGGTIYETVHRRKDGTTFPVEVSTRILEREGGAGWYSQDIIRDISDRRAAEEDLARTMRELERKNRELDAFTRTAAHDLRQPLTVIGGYVGHLRRVLSPSLGTEHRRIFDQVDENVEHMSRFLEDLLILSRFDVVSPPAERIAIGRLMEEVAGWYEEPLAKCQGRWSVDGTVPDILMPAVRASEVFENLFSNAVKYSRTGVPLRVEVGVLPASAEAPAGHRVFTFRDNGKGIAPEDQGRVFDLFFRAQDETVSGTGLGLAIVKGAVEQAGGFIRMESIPGEGTTFFFSLPVAEEG